MRAKPTSKPGGSKPSGPRKRVEREDPSGGDEPPRQITVRVLVFTVVLLMAFVLITPTLRAYVRQQEEQRELNAELAAANDEAKRLDGQIKRWNDDDFIKSQARDRFGFVMPGETPYRVIDPETVTGEEPELESDLVTSLPAGVGPWYLDVWESVHVAGEMEP